MLRCRIALSTLLAALSACNAPPREKAPEQPAIQKKTAPPFSTQQIHERSEKCGKLSRDQFRRGWNNGTLDTEEGHVTAEFTSHYNVKLDTCFYLLTVASAATLKKMLFDINGGELYGEYLGPAIIESPAAVRPKTCRVESFYCASGGEWQVLATPYMED